MAREEEQQLGDGDAELQDAAGTALGWPAVVISLLTLQRPFCGSVVVGFGSFYRTVRVSERYTIPS